MHYNNNNYFNINYSCFFNAFFCLGDCLLEILRLAKYKNAFIREEISGALLQDLDELGNS